MTRAFVNTVASTAWVGRRTRLFIYRFFGVSVGRADVRPGCFLGNPSIRIGDGTFINWRVFIDGAGSVAIESECSIGMDVLLLTSSHQVGPPSRRAGLGDHKDIVVGAGSWIGARAVILPGVRIGPGCVIGAGSVVTRDTEPNCVYAGNPARKLRHIDAPEEVLPL